MDDFGPKRPASDGAVKAKGGRPKKKPEYDKNQVMEDMIQRAAELFGEPYDDRKVRSPDAPIIVDVADQMETSTLRVRRMLITAGVYSTDASRKVQKLYKQGLTIPQIMQETGLSRTSVNGYLPYTKGAYKLDAPSLYAEQSRLYRRRKTAVTQMKEHMDDPDAESYLWKAIKAFEDYPFETAKGLPMKYKIKGGEMFFNRKEKSVTKATVLQAFHKARVVQKEEGFVRGPKKQKTFGASYLYAVFLRLGVCQDKKDET